MSGYQRFLPRDETRTTAHPVAEVAEAAEAAEVKAFERDRAAEALLKPAEVGPRTRQAQQASAELQQQRSHGIPELQQVQQLQQAPGPGHARPGIPAEWCEGVLRLSTMPQPRTYPAQAWQQLIVDAERFLSGWAAQAHRLGWPAWELFGCHNRAPWGRIQGMGLVLLLHGDALAALTASEAVIRRASGAHQTRRRKAADPLTAAERCLIWELA
jgi:hypothetical protein